MDQDLYERAKNEIDMWAGMGQGLTFQGVESYPELFEAFPGIEDLADSFFNDYLNPFGDKIVHFGAFYGGSKFTMKGMDYVLDDASDEALMAGAFLATTLVGGGVEHLDNYVDMADLAANYAGWYLASENYLDEGPTRKMLNYLKEDESVDYSISEHHEENLIEEMEYLGKA